MAIFGDERLKYIKKIMHENSNIPIYYSMDEIPDFFEPDGGGHSHNYLIFEKDDKIEVLRTDNGKYYHYEPWSSVDDNKAVLSFFPGALSKEKDKLLAGEIRVCSDLEATKELFRLMTNNIKRNFINAKGGYWIGRDALDTYYNKARFLDGSMNQREEYDWRFSNK